MTRTEAFATPGSAAIEIGGHRAHRIRFIAEQRNAFDFLRSKTEKAVKVLVGDQSTGKTTILNRVCTELEDCIVLRRSSATGATNSLMTSLLRSAGLNPEKLSGAVLENLLTVFLEHQKTIARRVVIVVDGAEQLELEDWSELERLHALQYEDRADFELIIAGRPKVYEHLHSPLGRWHRVQTRFHTLRTIKKPASRDVPTESKHLIITQDGEVIDRPALKERTLIGRNVHNDICLKHANVSRHHAVVVSTPDGYYVVDLNSKNGLMVNGEPVTSAVLRNNDIVVLGPYRLKLAVQNAPSQRDPRPPAPSLSDTATMRVKQLSRHLEGRLLGDLKSSAS